MNRIFGFGLALVGLAVVFGKNLFGNLTENFQDGISFKPIGVRVRLTDNFNIPYTDIGVPTSIEFLIDVGFKNSNAVKLGINNMRGNFRYGKGGQVIMPITANSAFEIPANGDVVVTFSSKRGFLELTETFKTLFKDKKIKRVFLDARVDYELIGGNVKGTFTIEEDIVASFLN